MSGRWTMVGLGAAFVAAAGLVYAAFASDLPPSAPTGATPGAGVLALQARALGEARVLPSNGPDPRIEITFARNADLMPDDLGAVSLTTPFVIGQMRTATSRETLDGGLVHVRIHHRILPAVAWFQDEAARRNRAWLGALMQWELDVTQRELLSLYPDASVPEAGVPQPPALTVTGLAVSYASAVKVAPELAAPAAKKFLCMGEDVCDDALLSKVLVILVE